MAGVAAGAFHLKVVVCVKPDKVHRDIRELTLAEGHCCGKVFEKTKLWSEGKKGRPITYLSNAELLELRARR